MRVNRFLIFCSLYGVTLFCTAGESDYAKVADELATYTGNGYVIGCDSNTYQQIMEAICSLPENKKKIATYYAISNIYTANDSIVDRNKKVMIALQYLSEKKLPLSVEILSGFLPLIDSETDGEIRLDVFKYLIGVCDISYIVDSSEKSYKMVVKIK